ncbi:ester cyclase [Qipengyuania qiaonensis]|uniref:Ester cyclase n=1 Tax=Qipengyuania qiaonensis TaxID=2867240 RepID=A0ABS7J7L7_9SPHN|nr:ester cyclase [Qipengyuania qiaonensis]MBX7481618.1 ester cyclase [Qipengyuania qiaonensis]
MPFDPTHLGHLFAEILNTRALDRFAELVAPDYINHNPYAGPGLEGVRDVFGAILAGIPDLVVTVEDVIASADGTKLVGRYRYEGTHSGNFMGYPATGNAVTIRSIDIWRIEDGRFVEHWDELNTLDLFTQVGAVHMASHAEAN